MPNNFIKLEDLKGLDLTIEDCEKKIKILTGLFDKEPDVLERLELNKYILRPQSRLATLRVQTINGIFDK